MRRTIPCLLMMACATAAVAADGGLEGMVGELGRTRWRQNNRVELLVYPEQAWQARLDLIDRARHHIFVSAFAWHDDPYGKEFAVRLARAVAERRRTDPGFTVYCMIDASAMGAFNLFRDTLKDLREAGAEVRPYNSAMSTTTPLYDGRMHDKMLIVDGRWALVTGRNLAEEYFDPQEWWLDFDLLVEGETVWDLQMHYLKEWAAARDLARASRFLWPEEQIRRRIRHLWQTGRFPDGSSPLEKYLTPLFFPTIEPLDGARPAAVLYDNSLVRTPAVTTELVAGLVRGARSEIDLMTPFPNLVEVLTTALEDAAARGLRVRIFVNSGDAAIRSGPFWLAGLPTVMRLISSGAEVWEWSGDGPLRRELDEVGCRPPLLPPVALHGKLLRIDDRLVVVHSSNFNVRSTYYNTEAGLAVLDPGLNRQLAELLDGLVSLRDLRLACGDGIEGVTVDHVVRRLAEEDLERLREALGNKQRFLDSMAVLW